MSFKLLPDLSVLANGPDAFILQVDKALRTVFATAASRRPYPDAGVEEVEMSES
jgi:hypothetical protein